ncbi:hypothetical protein CANCADRAFT_78979 [Tortispora caseinolytica NRRL Y-17796]|uniref:Uncharacterized protein n=1 Tax=Tortispora caseinolytica NRRL Y-17796 TaxID=767744 RepID=A0A1E4TJM9_9ASCO|nr:hypothetical protein CANCADRAFT_78979 [Tortispora caseinolytica NRRL Y-17796]
MSETRVVELAQLLERVSYLIIKISTKFDPIPEFTNFYVGEADNDADSFHLNYERHCHILLALFALFRDLDGELTSLNIETEFFTAYPRAAVYIAFAKILIALQTRLWSNCFDLEINQESFMLIRKINTPPSEPAKILHNEFKGPVKKLKLSSLSSEQLENLRHSASPVFPDEFLRLTGLTIPIHCALGTAPPSVDVLQLLPKSNKEYIASLQVASGTQSILDMLGPFADLITLIHKTSLLPTQRLSSGVELISLFSGLCLSSIGALSALVAIALWECKLVKWRTDTPSDQLSDIYKCFTALVSPYERDIDDISFVRKNTLRAALSGQYDNARKQMWDRFINQEPLLAQKSSSTDFVEARSILSKFTYELLWYYGEPTW